jgi:hypothetical protein
MRLRRLGPHAARVGGPRVPTPRPAPLLPVYAGPHEGRHGRRSAWQLPGECGRASDYRPRMSDCRTDCRAAQLSEPMSPCFRAVRLMPRRSRKPLYVVRRTESSNLSPSVISRRTRSSAGGFARTEVSCRRPVGRCRCAPTLRDASVATRSSSKPPSGRSSVGPPRRPPDPVPHCRKRHDAFAHTPHHHPLHGVRCGAERAGAHRTRRALGQSREAVTTPAGRRRAQPRADRASPSEYFFAKGGVERRVDGADPADAGERTDRERFGVSPARQRPRREAVPTV